MYLAALADGSHALKSLVKMLSTLDPSFDGKYFEYTPQDEELFMSLIDLTTAIGISQTTGIVEFSGYPLWFTATDATTEVPDFFPASVYYADDDEDQATPLQKTFSQWVSDQNYTLYDYAGGVFAGNFNRYSLPFAAQVLAADGFGLMGHATAVTELAGE